MYGCEVGESKRKYIAACMCMKWERVSVRQVRVRVSQHAWV